MKFFCVRNLVTHDISDMVPWEYKPNIPDYTKDDKEARKRWWSTPNTNHLFYNMFEGEHPAVRISKNNPPVKMYGFVADYDVEITPEMYEHPNLENVSIMPTAWSMTSSGRGRMLWALERMLPLPDMKTTSEFLKVVTKEFNLKEIWPEFDESFYRPTQYYECGHSWRVLEQNKVPHNVVCGLMSKAWERCNRKLSCNIPLEMVYPELERKFPGAWEGAFVIGARTRRFWDRGANNPSSAVLRANGFQCFSGDKAFIPWSDLLDKSFIDSIVANKMQEISDGIFFDGRNYFRKNNSDDWLLYNKEDIKLFLRVRMGLTAKPSSQSAVSELDRTLCFVQDTNRVDSVLPCVNRKPGIIELDGQRILNIYKSKPTQPIPDDVKVTPKDFPWLANFFHNLFDNEEQLPYFLGWLKRFYEDSLFYLARSGHAIFLAGNPNLGKTLIADFIVPKMVGGFRDASAFLLGEDGGFTAPFMEVPVLTVNDEQASSDETKHTKYSSVIKKLVANKDFYYNQKYEKAGSIKWCGRVIVTCNTDPKSLRLLPDVEISMLDKIMMFKLSEIKKDFFEGFTTHIERELPYFCRWLLRWPVPADIIDDSRFGIKRYLHKQLYMIATQTGSGNAFQEIVMLFLKAHCTNYTGFWEGTTAKLLSDMMNEQESAPLVNRMTVRYAGTMLGQLQSQGFPVFCKHTRRGTQWQMPYDLDLWVSKEMNDEGVDNVIFNPAAISRTYSIFQDVEHKSTLEPASDQ